MPYHGLTNIGSFNAPQSKYYDSGKFGRIFQGLPSFADDNEAVRDRLKEIGKKTGLLDAQDDLSDPVALIVDAAKNVNNPNNPDLTAGMTFVGQFLDHDMTFDPTSNLERQNDPEAIANFRTPMLELDNVYGLGPGGSPHLYDQTIDGGLTSFLVEEIPGSGAQTRDGQSRFDQPRNRQLVALIGDPRNDENLILSQFHLAMLRFHNAVVADVKAGSPAALPFETFREAQRLVRWHYQWIIVHEFLPKTIGRNRTNRILDNGRKFYQWRHEPFIPVEFAVGAYRFGHSQVRPSYRANFGPADAQQFFALIFNDQLPASTPDPDDLRGGRRAPRRFIDWQTFFDFGDGKVRPNKKIDTKLSTPLFDLIGIPANEPQSLAQRNLLRHVTFSVPSGQRIARAMKAPVLAEADLAELKPFGMHRDTPLWYYVLKEAEVMADGRKMGPVGGRIVGEVFIGLLQGDPMSYLCQDPQWTPIYGAGGNFTLVNLLNKAGVVHPVS